MEETETARATGAGWASAMEGLTALANLLICADERRWRSLAAPSARGLGLLLHAGLGRLEDALDEDAPAGTC